MLQENSFEIIHLFELLSMDGDGEQEEVCCTAINLEKANGMNLSSAKDRELSTLLQHD